jgi:hypothetical protein
MDCLSPTSPVERVVFMKAAQLGATEMGSNWIGYVIHHAPGPMMAVWPTVEMAKRNSKQRIDPLIEVVGAGGTDCTGAQRTGNTILAKEFRGGVLVMTGANSAVGCARCRCGICSSTRSTAIRWTSRVKAMRSRWPSAYTHLRAAQDLHRLDADDLRGIGYRARVRGQ